MKKSTRMVLFMTILLIMILAISTSQILAASTPPGKPRHPDFSGDLVRLHKSPPSQQESRGARAPLAPNWDASPYSQFVFMSWRDYTSAEIYTADGYMGNQTLRASNSAIDYLPRLNRGCTKIAFASSRDGDYEIHTMNPDGSGVTRLFNNSAVDRNPFWSPDGSKIVFETNRHSSQYEIYSMNNNGTSLTRLTTNNATDWQPAYSPDGSKIAFSSNRSGQYAIWVMDANGANPVQLSVQPGSEDPVWSPDGTQIAYDADSNGNDWWELWVMNADGSGQHMVRELSYGSDWGWDIYVRSWSPDGRYIAYTSIYWQYDYDDATWYWWYAYLDAWDLQLASAIDLGGTDLDWQPDWQTCDNLPPITALNALPAYSPASFLVSWGGADQGLAGIKNYDIQVRDGLGGTWTDWLVDTTNTSLTYNGTEGHQYYFRSRAMDRAYNQEAYPGDYETYTYVDTMPPTSSVNPLAAYVNGPFLVSWSGSDPAGSGVGSYDIQVRDGLGGVWTDWKLATTMTSDTYSGTSGHTYYFRSRARDLANNLEDYPASADAFTLLDSDFPSSAVTPLPAYSPGTFTVFWSGSDTGGSGLQSYDIQYRDGPSGGWVDWQMGTSATSAPFTGSNGHTYFFRSRARDNALNLEAWPVDPDTSTLVDAYGPYSHVSPLPAFSHPGVTVEWSGFDNYGGTGLASFDVQFKDTGSGDWQDWLVGVSITSTTFSGTPGHTYLFRSRARDQADNVEEWPTGDGDTSTTLYIWKVGGEVTDNAGTPIQGAGVTSLPPMFLSPGSGPDGTYDAYNANVAAEYEVTFAKTGYGTLPPASLDGSSDAVFNAVLPPTNNIVQNWGFESGALMPAWTAGGVISPSIELNNQHTGEFAALVGDDSGGVVSVTGYSSVSQPVTVALTMTHPTLSFLLNLDGEPDADYSWFEASIQEGPVTTRLLTQTVSTEGWDHFWFDLSAWAGESITLTFKTYQTASQQAAWAYLDEVSLGSSHPDVWVEKSAWDTTVLPGGLITYTLTYGNRGATPASQVVLTDTLPAELVFVTASVTPDATSPALVWELGDLPAGSGPYTITVTAMVVATPASPITITNEVTITTDSSELEVLNNDAEADVMIGSKVGLPYLVR